MSVRVLDSWALLAFLKGEPSAEEVGGLLKSAAQGRDRLLMCVINWGEVYYSFMKAGGREAAESAASDISRMPIEIFPVNADLELVRQAASYKAQYKMSYADAFAAALSKEKKAELVTGDPEFKSVEKEVKIRWLK
ncbi:MAG: type II toxin-antitoxin system VapC family toxin [Kiritimatiellae bacterium]|nr:type II toxin-antitoxin system VapC family toxin [Kiritimatiellia bacterium]MDD5522788.1 type II toxin-antitoxin system VapC family toxin [Kiritimatiellia bacterium]